MPYLHILISGEPDDTIAAAVSERAVELTATLLGKDRALTAVVVDFIGARGHWSIGGVPLLPGRPPSYHWSVSITDETNTKHEKAAYLKAVHAAMQALLGGAAEQSYTHIADLRGSAYGYGGRTQEDRYHHPG